MFCLTNQFFFWSLKREIVGIVGAQIGYIQARYPSCDPTKHMKAL